jgi:hypothetical protein
VKLTPEERLDIVTGRHPEFYGVGIVTFTHGDFCDQRLGGKCNCVVDLELEVKGMRYKIDAIGNLTTVSAH